MDGSIPLQLVVEIKDESQTYVLPSSAWFAP